MKKKNAYFTVEAATVVTITIYVLALLIYLAFYQYNRCLLEQDMGALALRGCTVWAEDKEELMREMKVRESKINRKKYIVWKAGKTEIELSHGSVEVSGSGQIRKPLNYLLGEKGKKHWRVTAEYKNQRIDPVSSIRLYRKLTGGS